MHEGEAHSIFLAEKMDAVFMTDDNAAFDFAMRRFNLGPGRVKDTVDVLRDSVAMGFITKEIAAATAESMEERDRALRVVHRGKITPNYFM